MSITFTTRSWVRWMASLHFLPKAVLKNIKSGASHGRIIRSLNEAVILKIIEMQEKNSLFEKKKRKNPIAIR